MSILLTMRRSMEWRDRRDTLLLHEFFNVLLFWNKTNSFMKETEYKWLKSKSNENRDEVQDNLRSLYIYFLLFLLL